VANPLTLQELSQVANGALFSLAVFIGKTRLIDNILYEYVGVNKMLHKWI
jgi:pantothenate synthetase